jgi:adenine-specific DNA-methyltransferase
MDKKISTLIKTFADNEMALNRLVVTSYIQCNKLCIDCGYLLPFVVTNKDELKEEIDTLKKKCTIEDVINIFELAIPKSEQTTNGAVYTPKYIRDYVVSQVLHSTTKDLQDCLCADISCGCGAFLYTLMDEFHRRTNMSCKEILHKLYGIDISSISIGRAKILLALVALQHGEIIEESDFRLFYGDSLTYDFKSLQGVGENGGFDIIVGNPPYVRSKNIDVETKKNLPLWSTSKIGNADLYIPFFEIGLTILSETGLLGYITVNTFFKSVNARALRHYLTSNSMSIKIIDFGEQKVFKKKLAYTCLAFMSKVACNAISYVKADIADVQAQKDFDYNEIYFSLLDNHRGWNLNDSRVLKNVRLIENAGTSLGDSYVMKNGIATLANDVFIFKPINSDDDYYHLLKDNVEYKIEKGICRNIIKPNIIKTEIDIPAKAEKIIIPYDADNNILSESFFKNNYPKAYEYLSSQRETLDSRDKGEGDYEAWFAFGRTQAIADSGLKLLFPYMSDVPHFVYTADKDMMIYCGYAIYNESETELLFLKRVLESNVFDYYMRNTSKPYSAGYYSYAKNYVKNFGMYPFSDEQKKHILNLKTQEEVNTYIQRLYRVNI